MMDAAGTVRSLIADKGYDADRLRKRLKGDGAKAVIPGRSNRKTPIRYDEARCEADDASRPPSAG